MNNTKTYIIGYNRYSNKIVKYSTEEHAQMSGTWYRVLEADSYKSAVEEFTQLYQESHTEIE